VLLRLDHVVDLDDLSPEWAWGGATGAGVRVAIVDSGIDATHPALEGCVDTAGSASVERDPDGALHIVEGPHEDGFGHGTACAGIVHALAPDATITSVRVLGPQLTGTSDVFLAGLTWAVEQGFDVINLSLGSRKRDHAPCSTTCDQAYFGGTLLTTAANNINRVTYLSLSAGHERRATCRPTRCASTTTLNHPPSSWRGIEVEVPWLDHTTITTTGNSFAAPHIAGIAARILSKHPDLRPFQLKTVLWATSANVRDAGEREQAGRLTRVMQAPTALRATYARPAIVAS
jgi:subtilisin family serine protease